MQVGNRNNGGRHEIAWVRVVILVVSWLIIFSLVQDVWQIRTGFDRITESEKRLAAEEKRHESLVQKLGLVQTKGYKEKQIREKLNMQKEGEVIVVMPKNGGLATENTIYDENSLQVWEKWWNLLK